MVIDELVRATASQLSDNARFEAEQIVMYALRLCRLDLITKSKRAVSEKEIDAVSAMTERRKMGEPLGYILGECEFMGLPFYVESGVLIPRADTETLVETVVNGAGDRKKVLDICTGSGCIGISLARFIPDARVTMLDISDIAVETAKKNAALSNVSDRVTVEKCDILREYPKDAFDIIVSNPPYIETNVIETLQTEVKDYEPRLALDGGGDGLDFYRRITAIAPQMLEKGGMLAFEIGYNQGEAVRELMKKDFKNIEIIKDLAGNDRVVTGIYK